MLEILDTGKLAHKYGKHRGWIIAAYGVVTCLVGLAIHHFQDVIFMMAPAAARPPEPTAITWLAIALYAIGAIILLWAVWQLYKDEVRSDYRRDAEHYRRNGW